MAKLTEKQELAIRLLTDPEYKGLTQEEIAQRVGVSRKQLWVWRTKHPEFVRALKTAYIAQTLKDPPAVLDAMVDAAVTDRNAQAAKLILQTHGIIGDKPAVAVKSMKVDVSMPEKLAELKERLARLTGRGE